MLRSSWQPQAGPCAFFLFLTLLISNASDTGPTPTTDPSNRGKQRKQFRLFEDLQRGSGLVLRKPNNTGMIDIRGAVIELDDDDKEILRTTIALAAGLYGLAALYGILHLPMWNILSRLCQLRKRVGPSSAASDYTVMDDLPTIKSKKGIRWASFTYTPQRK